MHNFVPDVAQYSVFSTLDLKSAYHQVEISIEDLEAFGLVENFTRAKQFYWSNECSFVVSTDN